MFDSVSPIFWILLSILFGSSRRLMARALIKNQEDTTALLALDKFFGVLFLVSIIFALSSLDASILDFHNVAPIGWLSLCASAILYSAASFIVFRATRTIEAGERAILNQLTVVIILGLSFSVLGESLTPYLLSGAILIMVGSALCTYRKSGHRWGVEGVKLIILSCILIAIASMFDKISANYFSPILLSIPYVLLTAVVAFLLMRKGSFPRIKKVWRAHEYSIIILSSLSVLSFLFYYMALKITPLSQIYPLKASQGILTTIGGIIFLGEDQGIRYKIIGAILAIGGAILIHS